MKKAFIGLMILLSLLLLSAESLSLVEFRLETEQWAFSHPETLIISFEDSLVIYPGLYLRGQEDYSPQHPEMVTPLDPDDLMELFQLISSWEGVLQRDMDQIPPDRLVYPRLVFVWRDSQGEEILHYYYFREARDCNHFIYPITERYSGHRFWDSLFSKYDFRP